MSGKSHIPHIPIGNQDPSYSSDYWETQQQDLCRLQISYIAIKCKSHTHSPETLSRMCGERDGYCAHCLAVKAALISINQSPIFLSKQAKKMVESLPQEIKVNVAKEEAEKMKAALEAAGGKVVLE